MILLLDTTHCKHGKPMMQLLAYGWKVQVKKAFCAGGDIVAMYHAMAAMPEEPVQEVVDFFHAEYRLDYLIQTYQKPLLVWG